MEKYRGTEEQVGFIRSWLEDYRKVLPLGELSQKTTNHVFENWIQNTEAGEELDLELFMEIISNAASRIRNEYDPDFELLPFERFVVGTLKDP